jgi:alanine racemase
MLIDIREIYTRGGYMFKYLRPTWVEIDLDNLEYNMKEIRRIAKSKEIIAVIKADAYGHGALEIAPILIKNGATRLAVALITEAMELRQGGIEAPIFILGYTPIDYAKEIIENDIEVTVYSYEYAEELSRIAVEYNKNIKIHIAVDTGMGRIGFLPVEESVKDVYKISKLSNIIIEGLFSHFSSSDEKEKEYTNKQMNKFIWFDNKLQEFGININIKHIANSAAVIDLPDTHLDAVRPGIIIFGCYPSEEVTKENINLKPVMSLKANITHVKNLPSGEFISYGRKFQTKRDSCIATIPIGYADGYTRLLFNKGKVIIKGQLVPIVGRICMDQCMIDVTGIDDVKIGDEVILMGESNGTRITAEDLAELLDTINYEVVCMISKRVPRVFVKDDKVVKIRNYV